MSPADWGWPICTLPGEPQRLSGPAARRPPRSSGTGTVNPAERETAPDATRVPQDDDPRPQGSSQHPW